MSRRACCWTNEVDDDDGATMRIAIGCDDGEAHAPAQMNGHQSPAAHPINEANEMGTQSLARRWTLFSKHIQNMGKRRCTHAIYTKTHSTHDRRSGLRVGLSIICDQFGSSSSIRLSPGCVSMFYAVFGTLRDTADCPNGFLLIYWPSDAQSDYYTLSAAKRQIGSLRRGCGGMGNN